MRSTFAAKKSTLKARQKWLASGSITLGSIIVDEGAAKALKTTEKFTGCRYNKG
ncbi:MAG: hypothetical protein WDO19_32285 [Bacteroidota bacterium]